MYSQNKEEIFILEYFKDFKGRFLDIGAYDGKTFSNTLALAERRWSGICIEPSASVFPALLKTHEQHNVECVNAAFAKENKLVKFYDSNGDAVSTTSEKHKQIWSIVDYKSCWIHTITFKDIIDTFGGGFDFINLDVEGTNIELLKTLDLTDVKMICVEYDRRANEVKEYCVGFNEIHRNGENIILVR